MAIIQTTIAELRNLTSTTIPTITLDVNDIYYTMDPGQEGEWKYLGPHKIEWGYTDNTGTILNRMTSSTHGHVFARIYDGYVNVKWFGAKGDTVTDDTVAIQRALDTMSNTTTYTDFGVAAGKWPAGNTLFFPQGTYIITDTLLVGYNFRILGVSNRSVGNGPEANIYLSGSLIKCNFSSEDEGKKWAISSAALDISTGSLLGYDEWISAQGTSVTNSYLNYTMRPGIWIEGLRITGNAFGGIRLANAYNSTIRNVNVNGTNVGFMINASWYATIENCFVISFWYGAVVTECNFAGIISSSFSGMNYPGNESYVPLIDSEDLPDFIYHDQPYADLGLDDKVKRGKTGVYAFGNELSIIDTSVEQTTNGFTFLNCITSMQSCYTEITKYYGITCGGTTEPVVRNGQLVINGMALINADYAFFFGKNVLASIDSAAYASYTSSFLSQLFEYTPNTGRTITFSNTLYENRRYMPDIVFLNEGANGQNLGSVYIDPIGGSDNNYGFNENDALATFDAALVRVQNQSTLNPVKKILLKRGGTANKNENAVEIENADILVTSYGAGANNSKLIFQVGLAPTYKTGYILLGPNVKLTFKEVDIDVSNTTVSPTAVGSDVSFFCVKEGYGQVNFEKLTVNLRKDYALVSNYTGSYALFETKMVSVVINDTRSVSTGNAILCSSVGFMAIECTQFNSTITPNMQSLLNRGWNAGLVVRNNL
jgi:hypothetical protein